MQFKTVKLVFIRLPIGLLLLHLEFNVHRIQKRFSIAELLVLNSGTRAQLKTDLRNGPKLITKGTNEDRSNKRLKPDLKDNLEQLTTDLRNLVNYSCGKKLAKSFAAPSPLGQSTFHKDKRKFISTLLHHHHTSLIILEPKNGLDLHSPLHFHSD